MPGRVEGGTPRWFLGFWMFNDSAPWEATRRAVEDDIEAKCSVVGEDTVIDKVTVDRDDQGEMVAVVAAWVVVHPRL